MSISDDPSPHVFDADDATFDTEVLKRSHQVPVVVDFWAAWCGPCRTLGPMLESAVTARDGEIVLAKVDVDANPAVARRFRVQGIPQVYAFRDGQPVSQFTGVIPQQQLDGFLEALVPTPADRLVAEAADLEAEEAEVALRRALELDPGHRGAAIALAERLVEQDPDAALGLISPHRPDPAAEAVASRASLARDGEVDIDGLRAQADRDDVDGLVLLRLGRALAARGDYDEALERLLRAVELGDAAREPAREQLLALFGMIGDGDERVNAARMRLARALF